MTFELRTLKQHYLYHPIRRLTMFRALRIISERSTKGDTRDLLLAELASRNKVYQRRALNALNFLVSNRARTSPILHFLKERMKLISCSYSNFNMHSTCRPTHLYCHYQLPL